MTAALARRISVAGILLALIMIGVAGAVTGCATIDAWKHVDQ